MKMSYFCKKGGVGKTTITGEHANYLASQGNKVLIVSIDDQNSIFEMFGKFSLVFKDESNYLENLILKKCTLEEALIEFRPNLSAIKTLNTDMLSKKLTLERAFEKAFLETVKSFEVYDYVFFDLPPSSNRTTEILLDQCDAIMLIVELNKLGVNGFYNTIQYFVDCDIPLDKIKYIVPNGFSKNKSVPQVAYDDLVALVNENLENVQILENIPEKSAIQMAQQKGVSIFDRKATALSAYGKSQKKIVKEHLKRVFDSIQL